jgi:hypothetical protein
MTFLGIIIYLLIDNLIFPNRTDRSVHRSVIHSVEETSLLLKHTFGAFRNIHSASYAHQNTGEVPRRNPVIGGPERLSYRPGDAPSSADNDLRIEGSGVVSDGNRSERRGTSFSLAAVGINDDVDVRDKCLGVCLRENASCSERSSRKNENHAAAGLHTSSGQETGNITISVIEDVRSFSENDLCNTPRFQLLSPGDIDDDETDFPSDKLLLARLRNGSQTGADAGTSKAFSEQGGSRNVGDLRRHSEDADPTPRTVKKQQAAELHDLAEVIKKTDIASAEVSILNLLKLLKNQKERLTLGIFEPEIFQR